MATDPVCGMYVDETTSTLTAVVRGRKSYFCSETCLETFTAPEKEMARLKRLIAFSLGVGLPMFVVTFGQGLGWWLMGLDEPVNLVFFILATPVQFVAGWRFYRGTWDAFRNRSGKGRRSEAIRKLMDRAPRTARVVRNGREEEIPIELVQVDDLFVVRPGERVPVDGIIVEGFSAIDESMVT